MSLISALTGGATTTAKIGDVNAAITQINEALDALETRIGSLATKAEVADVETTLERLRPPSAGAATVSMTSELGKPRGLDPNKIEMVYDHVTLYYGDLALFAKRIEENTWRLVATLNYIVVSPAVWTYDETVTGTVEEVYEHARKRLEELAELKPRHDAVHDRVRRMSEGQE